MAHARSTSTATHQGPTYQALFGTLAAAVVGLVAAGLVFGNSIITRAEAAGARSEDRIEKRLGAIESKVDRITEFLIGGK